MIEHPNAERFAAAVRNSNLSPEEQYAFLRTVETMDADQQDSLCAFFSIRPETVAAFWRIAVTKKELFANGRNLEAFLEKEGRTLAAFPPETEPSLIMAFP